MNKTPSLRKPHWWKTALKAGVFLAVLCLTLVALAVAWISFTGRRELAMIREELVASGEPLSLAEMVPPSIPDSANFFADPLWMELADLVETEQDGVKTKTPRLPEDRLQLHELVRPLTESERVALESSHPHFAGELKSETQFDPWPVWQKSEGMGPTRRRQAAEFILASLASKEPALDRLSDLAQRPGARLPVSYDDFLRMSPSFTNYFTSTAQILRLRATARLELGQNERAEKDVFLTLRLADALKGDPLLVLMIVRMAILSIAAETIGDGIRAHLWMDADLESFERKLEEVDLVSEFATALRGERAWANQGLESLLRQVDDFRIGIFLPAQEASYQKLMRKWIAAADEAGNTGLRDSLFFAEPPSGLFRQIWAGLTYDVFFGANFSPRGLAKSTAAIQDQVTMTRVACALERYRLKRGDYPESLASLASEFLTVLPRDVVTLQPLRYRREGSGFLLWTPGWNERDEGGGGDDWVWKR